MFPISGKYFSKSVKISPLYVIIGLMHLLYNSKNVKIFISFKIQALVRHSMLWVIAATLVFLILMCCFGDPVLSRLFCLGSIGKYNGLLLVHLFDLSSILLFCLLGIIIMILHLVSLRASLYFLLNVSTISCGFSRLSLLFSSMAMSSMYKSAGTSNSPYWAPSSFSKKASTELVHNTGEFIDA